MNLPYIIFYINLIVWLLPPFRQYGSKLFLFFVILAISDPSVLLFHYAFEISRNFLYLIIVSLLFYSVIKNLKVAVFILLIVILSLLIDLSDDVYRVFISLLFFALLFLFFKRLVVSFFNERIIRYFDIVLVLYVTSLILKFIIHVFNPSAGIIYFYLSTAFQIFIAIFFVLYNENNSPIIKFREE